MSGSLFPVPESVTFEEAIALSQTLLDQVAVGALPEPEIEQAITTLVQHQAGARGFFVVYLTDSRTIADNPSSGVLQALRSAPEAVADLLVKNLAMSSAMTLTHRRSQNKTAAQDSERVRSRTANLMQHLQLPAIQAQAQQLLESVTTGQGAYQAFLERWDYDAEQRQVIQQAFDRALDHLKGSTRES